MLSVHTSPLDQPGSGDAGGMNVYVAELSRHLAALGVEVEIFTRATSDKQPAAVRYAERVLVRHVQAGPVEELAKEDLGSRLAAFSRGLLGAVASSGPGFDIVHSHYWLSGQVGMSAAAHWNVPLVHTMHTMAAVKNSVIRAGDVAEPPARAIAEAQIVAAADRLVANTDHEASALVGLYGADPARVSTVAPGVDLEVFRPGSRAAARLALGLAADALVLLFVGRIQPLKAPDVLLRAAAQLLETDPGLRARLVVAVLGGPSGSGRDEPAALQRLAASLGIADVVVFRPPVERTALPDWYRAADVTVVPSHSESFGLVALESQACGTPVVASAVGGLETAVADGASGVLIDGHDPGDYAVVLGRLLHDPARRAALGSGGVRHAGSFSWRATAAQMLDVYEGALGRSAAMVDARRGAAGRL